MKSFFEFLGFVSTALISGFLVFTYVGHKKNADRPETRELVSAHDIDSPASLPEIKPISGSGAAILKEKKKMTSKGSVAELPAAQKPTLAVESVSVTEKLRGLYADEEFVASTAKKWKKAVAEAAETHSVKPHLLLGNVIVKSYLGNYTARDFNRDVSEHAGDVALPASTALKSYDYAWSVNKIAQQYNLTKYFPAAAPVAQAKATPSFSAPSTPKKSATSAAPKQTKPAATMSPAESGIREMVAKEEGFASWQGLQRLADPETKKNAERRVRTLMSAVRVK
ncbi:MAG: hypothetical protein KIS77_16975 [Saprospiraceae bacterium]|nr:hypothetical protein [Saprospiraceae bacterium]